MHADGKTATRDATSEEVISSRLNTGTEYMNKGTGGEGLKDLLAVCKTGFKADLCLF